ncbi:CorA metal ion transporter [Dispira parvispora]|uniref:CorA metal ion transporter n=1 Tax=Dispira parvispora TaxID=1520584 RepID=A0A9W8ANE4_9FUNG|nr:CorA metal ion transporter [Dispira parvispora]
MDPLRPTGSPNSVVAEDEGLGEGSSEVTQQTSSTSELLPTFTRNPNTGSPSNTVTAVSSRPSSSRGSGDARPTSQPLSTPRRTSPVQPNQHPSNVPHTTNTLFSPNVQPLLSSALGDPGEGDDVTQTLGNLDQIVHGLQGAEHWSSHGLAAPYQQLAGDESGGTSTPLPQPLTSGTVPSETHSDSSINRSILSDRTNVIPDFTSIGSVLSSPHSVGSPLPNDNPPTATQATVTQETHSGSAVPTIDYAKLRNWIAKARSAPDANQRKNSSSSLRRRIRPTSLDLMIQKKSSDSFRMSLESDSHMEEFYGGPGQPPDAQHRFMFYSAHCGVLYAEQLQGVQHKEDSLDTLMQRGPFWIDITRPTQKDMDLITQVFRIHPLTEEDILTEECREKCELFSHYYFTSFHTYYSDPDSPEFMEPISLFIIVMQDGILSFHRQPVHHPQNVVERMDALPDSGSVISPDWIHYALIDDITDSLSPLVELISREVESIDELVLILRANEQSDMLQRIGTARKKIMSIQRLVALKGYVIKALIRRSEERRWGAPSNGMKFYYADVLDHIITLIQDANQLDSIIHRAHSNFLAQISLEITIASNRANDMIAKVTALGSILLPMNVITGLFGMNVYVPGQEVSGYGWFFGIVGSLGLVFIICTILLYKLKIF